MRERIKRAVEWWRSIPEDERSRLAEYVSDNWIAGRTVPKKYVFPIRELARFAVDVLASIDVDVAVAAAEKVNAAMLDVTDEIIAKHGAPPPLLGKTRPDPDSPKISEIDPDVSSSKSVDYGEP